NGNEHFVVGRNSFRLLLSNRTTTKCSFPLRSWYTSRRVTSIFSVRAAKRIASPSVGNVDVDLTFGNVCVTAFDRFKGWPSHSAASRSAVLKSTLRACIHRSSRLRECFPESAKSPHSAAFSPATQILK